MYKVTLFEEYRLIERSESEVNGAWKGAHLLLFFMAFVFGSFCTFCFHMLMYLFDEKCVLFPKLLSLTSLKHNVIYEFLPVDKEVADMLPLDFLGTQWVEKSTCYLPTYVPLISGIFGLVWTTMFLMCSTGSRTLTGLQRPWRVLPPVFLFSLAMGFLCTYSAAVTHYGLNELCLKLGEITGSSTCTYTVNVATLAYERRIRGVYQAIRLTILSAWLHTICWLLSALLTAARVILAVDFQLVRVNVDLIGDIDRIMEHHEKQIHTVSPDIWFNNERESASSLPLTRGVRFKHRTFTATQTTPTSEDVEVLYKETSDVLYVATDDEHISEHSLLPEESHRIARMAAYQNVPKDKHFIVKMIYDLVLNMPESESSSSVMTLSADSFESNIEVRSVVRQLGHSVLDTFDAEKKPRSTLVNQAEAEEVAKEIRRYLHERQIIRLRDENEPEPSTSGVASYAPRKSYDHESVLNITDEMKEILESKMTKKSNMKNSSAQTDTGKSKTAQKVQITEPDETQDSATNTNQDIDKEAQTENKKEKQD